MLDQGHECQAAELQSPDGTRSLLLDMRSSNDSQFTRLLGSSSDFGASWSVRQARDMPDPHCEGSMVAGASRAGAFTPLYASNAASS